MHGLGMGRFLVIGHKKTNKTQEGPTQKHGYDLFIFYFGRVHELFIPTGTLQRTSVLIGAGPIKRTLAQTDASFFS